LALAHKEATLVSLTMRKQCISFGLDYSHVEDDIAHITSKLRFLKRLSEYMEHAVEAIAHDEAPG
jgi:hypothetical protein